MRTLTIGLVVLALLASVATFAAPDNGAATQLGAEPVIANSFNINATIAKFATVDFDPGDQNMTIGPDQGAFPNKIDTKMTVECNAPMTLSLTQSLGAALNDPANGGLPFDAMWNYSEWAAAGNAGYNYVASPSVMLYKQIPSGGPKLGTYQVRGVLPVGSDYPGKSTLGALCDFEPGINMTLQGTGAVYVPVINAHVACNINTDKGTCITTGDWTQIKTTAPIVAHVYATVQAK